MLSNIISRSTAAFGGAPFRLNKCTALSSAAGGAAGGAAVGGVPGALVGGCYVYAKKQKRILVKIDTNIIVSIYE